MRVFLSLKELIESYKPKIRPFKRFALLLFDTLLIINEEAKPQTVKEAVNKLCKRFNYTSTILLANDKYLLEFGDQLKNLGIFLPEDWKSPKSNYRKRVEKVILEQYFLSPHFPRVYEITSGDLRIVGNLISAVEYLKNTSLKETEKFWNSLLKKLKSSNIYRRIPPLFL